MARYGKIEKVGYSDLMAAIESAGAEIIDTAEGSLMDSILFSTGENGRVFAAYETYLNEWSSCYSIEFQKFPGRDVVARWDRYAAETEGAAV